MKKVVYLMIALAAVSCTLKEENKKPEEVETVKEESNTETVREIEKVKPEFIVTPEFWGNFNTEMKAVVFFSEKDSLSRQNTELVSSIEQHTMVPNTTYHQVYSSDSASFVYLNDTLMFDFTEYKNQFKEGYFLLKPGEMPYAFGFKEDLDYLVNEVKSYFN